MKPLNENISFFNNSGNEYINNNLLNLLFNGSSNINVPDTWVTTTFLRIIFVFISRLGFILMELGSIPIENVYKIIFYNILEIANSIVAYALTGYIFSFGKWSFNGVIGYSDDLHYEMDLAIFGFATTLLSTAQISTFLVGRIHLIGTIITTFLFSAFLQPMLMHWIWCDKGWMHWHTLQKQRVPVKDHGGTLVIHLPSCVIGVLGALFLGRRIIRVSELDEQSVGREHTATTVIGYIFIIFGYMAFILPSPMQEAIKTSQNYTSTVLVNSLIAIGTGILTICVIELCLYRTASSYWNVLRCLQGGIAGLISVSTAIDLYSPLMCAGIAFAASILFLLASIVVHVTAIEDHCNFTSSHLLCGFLGTMLCPMIIKEGFLGNTNRRLFILWQSLCILIVTVVSLVFGTTLFGFLFCANILRSKREVKNHIRAVALQQHLPKRTFFGRLFHINYQTAHIAPGENYRKICFDNKNISQDGTEGPSGDARALTI